MSRKAIDMTGRRYGRLVVKRRDGQRNNQLCWHCTCDCGKSTSVPGSRLRSGNTRSCGCLLTESQHGGFGTPEYQCWLDMKRRCYNRRTVAYKDYGGRGISVCDRWFDSFQNFIDDVGRRPSSSYSLDRINNDGNYEPGNVRWATRHQQSVNQRKSAWLCYMGVDRPLVEWASILDVKYQTVWKRYQKGWTAADVLFGRRWK